MDKTENKREGHAVSVLWLEKREHVIGKLANIFLPKSFLVGLSLLSQQDETLHSGFPHAP